MFARPLLQVVTMVAAATVGLWPAQGRACTCGAQVIARSNVAEGADDVPRNQALIIEGYLDAASITLESAAGARVDFELNHGPWPGCPGTWAELVPKQPLEAMTRYVVRATSRTSDFVEGEPPAALTFTTGSSLLPELPLAPPNGRVTMVEGVPEDGFSCGPSAIQACVGLEDADDVEIVARRGDEVIMRWMMPTEAGNFGFDVMPDCIEFRRRGPTGARSAPLTFCDDARNLRSFRESDLGSGKY